MIKYVCFPLNPPCHADSMVLGNRGSEAITEAAYPYGGHDTEVSTHGRIITGPLLSGHPQDTLPAAATGMLSLDRAGSTDH